VEWKVGRKAHVKVETCSPMAGASVKIAHVFGLLGLRPSMRDDWGRVLHIFSLFCE